MREFDSEKLGKEAVQALYQYVNWFLGPQMYQLWPPDLLPYAIMEQYQSSSLYRDIQLLARVVNRGIDAARRVRKCSTR